MDSAKDIFTIGIGGAAGQGVKSASIYLSQYLISRGYEVYLSFDYPSLIKGGHNFARLSFSKEKIWQDYRSLDVLIAFNRETPELHKNEIKEGALVIGEFNSEQIKADPEIIFSNLNLQSSEQKNELWSGNDALAEGFLAAGLNFYIGYPMTPSSSILHHMANKQKPNGLKVIHPENEISVINMALGMSYAGKRVAIGTATGGFALMQEAFSFAGMAELPLVVAVSQRQAPSTGAPTYSSQADLHFVINSGHGEFPRLVVAPGDPEEAFELAALALNLTWQFQLPATVLLDKVLSEHQMTVSLNREDVPVARGKIEENPGENYKRYRITDDGISPMAFPGALGAVVKVTSYEHKEDGAATEKANEIKTMIDKRFRKMAGLEEEMNKNNAIKTYGDPQSSNAIILFGSTKGAVLESLKHLNKPAKVVQIIWLEPFPKEKVTLEIKGKNIVCVEANHNGQLAALIQSKTGINIEKKILRYDSRPFDPLELAKEINALWN